MREGPGSQWRWSTLLAAAGIGIGVLVIGAVPASATPRSGHRVVATSTHSQSPRASATAPTDPAPVTTPTVGTSSGQSLDPPHPFASHRAVLDFVASENVVRLKIPTPPCPVTFPNCQWMLFVNEPDVPAKTIVGFVTGTSGILTIAYPTNFCGVIQADVYVGPPWHLRFGRKNTIDTAHSCNPPPVPSNPPSVVPAAASGTAPASATPAPATPAATVAPQPAKPGPSQLAFTGAEIVPLAIGGLALLFAGIYILTSLEQRRRALRRASKAMTPESVSAGAVKMSNWFMGE